MFEPSSKPLVFPASGAESGSFGSESANECNLAAILKNAVLLYPLETILGEPVEQVVLPLDPCPTGDRPSPRPRLPDARG